MSSYTPEDSVEYLSPEFVNASSEYYDWERANLIDEKVYSAETCSECGQVCVMDYLGENSHADWMVGHADDEDDEEDELGLVTDAYGDQLFPGTNVMPFVGFYFHFVEEEGQVVNLKVVDGEETYDPPVPEDELKEIDLTDIGIVEEIEGTDVLVRFSDHDVRIRLTEDEAGVLLEIVGDDVYKNLKRQHKLLSDCDETFYNEGPMMNSRYPVDVRRVGGPREAAKAIKHLPLCIVDIDQAYYLALTGGGMDLSWEIAEAYMCLGYLPPQFVHDLPRMAGRRLSDPRTKWVLEGVRKAARVQQDWAQQALDRLDRYWAELEAKEPQNAT